MSNLIVASRGRAIARRDSAMIYAILATGTAAAMTVDPMFWLATPLFGIVTLLASKRAVPRVEPSGALEVEETKGFWREDARLKIKMFVGIGVRFEHKDVELLLHSDLETSQLPIRVELAIHDAMAQLQSGEARRLLGDVVRQARPLFGMTSSNFDAAKDEEVRTEAADLVLACCDTALELGRIDTMLESGTRAKGGDLRTRDAALFDRCSAARTLFSTRLTDAASALGALYASGIERGTPASDRIAELVTDLNADAIARTAAKRELDQLLAPGTTRPERD